jgi:hypothetical protein
LFDVRKFSPSLFLTNGQSTNFPTLARGFSLKEINKKKLWKREREERGRSITAERIKRKDEGERM